MTALIGLDCESNGLEGKAFAAAAVLVDDTGREVDTWTGRCPIDGEPTAWVRANVLPVVRDLPVNLPAYHSLLGAFIAQWDRWRWAHPDALLVVHVLWPVEARFLLDAFDDPREGPYPVVDVAALLCAAGYDPTPAGLYSCLADAGIPVPEGQPHHPLFDARAAVAACRHLLGYGQPARRARAR